MTPGELLRRERERRAISVQQAAEDLHLDTAIVEAIEANKFAVLGAPVYARGHLRKYAARLGLSPEFIIQRYEALSDRLEVPTPVPPTVVTSVTVEQRRSWKVPLMIVAALLALAIAWWVYGLLTEANGAVLTPTMINER
jgi:cytoskeletal protein RodZ